ncbi:MAG: DUF2339 domain-containing protein [Balneolaceae bacterium]|nr:MAG: DUF2339 domain-containing protein [Balneolaceae bacterium]
MSYMPGKTPTDPADLNEQPGSHNPNEQAGSHDLNERISRLESGMRLLMQELEQIKKQGAAPATDRIPDARISDRPAGSATQESHRHTGTGSPVQSPTPAAGPPLHGRPPEPWKPPAKEPVFVPGPKKVIDINEWLTTENLINKVGIGLLLFGVAFLFKYSIDQGWLIPQVRLLFGLLLGIMLLYGGTRTYHDRRTFSLALLGGAIATFYITGFASFQIFELTSYSVTFSFMVAVTLLAFFLSLKQKDAVLSVIGTIGGLMTPFVFFTETGSLIWLVVYTILIIAGTSAIYYVKGWRSVLWVTVVAGSLVYLLGAEMAGKPSLNPTIAGTRFLQAGILLSWILLGVMPVFREQFRISSPAGPDIPGKTGPSVTEAHLHVLTVLMPLITLGLSAAIWSFSQATWGWIFFGASAVYALLALVLYRPADNASLWYVHALTGILLFTVGLFLVLKGHWLFFLLAAEAVVLHLAGTRFRFNSLKYTAHTLFGIVALWLFIRLENQAGELPFFNPKALSDLGVLAMAVIVSLRFTSVQARNVYLFAAHIALLMLTYRELAVLEHGLAFISLAWGAYAIGILITGLQMRNTLVRQAGLGTLLLVVAKLFLIDLATVDAIWRILLFLGFGGILLLLSYFFRPLWKSAEAETV